MSIKNQLGTIAAIWRHPMKSCGREALESVLLSQDEALPFDRRWALTHSKSKFSVEAPEWLPCANFSIGTKNPKFAAISSVLDETSRNLTLHHPEKESLSFQPEDEGDVAKAIQWLSTLKDAEQPALTSIVTLKARGVTDTDYPSISLLSNSSLATLSEDAGVSLDARRFRGNIWLGGLAPFAEFDLIGKTVTVGDATIEITEPIERCKLTTTNPETGIRDVDTLSLLRARFGHQNFGVYGRVVQTGKIRLGDLLRSVS